MFFEWLFWVYRIISGFLVHIQSGGCPCLMNPVVLGSEMRASVTGSYRHFAIVELVRLFLPGANFLDCPFRNGIPKFLPVLMVVF